MDKYAILEGLKNDTPYAKQCAIEYFTQQIQREQEMYIRAKKKKYGEFLEKLSRHCPGIFESDGMTANEIAFALSSQEGYARYSCCAVAGMLSYVQECLTGWRDSEAAKAIQKMLIEDLKVKQITWQVTRDRRGINSIFYIFITE